MIHYYNIPDREFKYDRYLAERAALIEKIRKENMPCNIRKAFAEKLAKGEVCGPAPIGYLNKPRDHVGVWEVVINQEYAPVIKEAFNLYSAGKHSVSDIMMFLRRGGLRPKKGWCITRAHVTAMLKNSFYCGYMSVNGQLYPHKYEALTDVKTFNKCQAFLKKGKAIDISSINSKQI